MKPCIRSCWANKRNLQRFNELDDALNFTEDIAIGIDWSDKIETNHIDFKIDRVDLLHQLMLMWS